MLFLNEQTQIEKPINLIEASIDTVNSVFEHMSLVETYIKDEFNTVLNEETKESFSTKIKRLIETCKNMIINAAKRVKAYIMKLIERVKNFISGKTKKENGSDKPAPKTIDLPENIVKALNECIKVESYLMALIGRVTDTNRHIKETHEHDQFESAFKSATELLHSPSNGKTVKVVAVEVGNALTKLMATVKHIDEKLVATFSKVPVEQYNQFLGQNITYLTHEAAKVVTLVGNLSTAYMNSLK